MGAEFDQNAVPCDICDQWTADICKECGNCNECCNADEKCGSVADELANEINEQLEMEKEKELWDM